MASQISPDILAKLEAQTREDPQLPRSDPTVSFWQLPPHYTLAEIQSDQLPATTDVAIIGSGITACSVTKHLLDHSASSSTTLSVTVFEARTLTSGATGRNGGLLSSFVPGEYKILVERFGKQQAVKIAEYANRTLEKMHQLGNSSEEYQRVSEIRRLQDVICFEDEESFREAVESHRLYEEDIPEERGKSRVLSTEEAAKACLHACHASRHATDRPGRNSTSAHQRARLYFPMAHSGHIASSLVSGPTCTLGTNRTSQSKQRRP
jgi:hypothetical protein